MLCSLKHRLRSKKAGFGKGQYVAWTLSSKASCCIPWEIVFGSYVNLNNNPVFIQMTAVSLQQYDLPDLESYVRRVTVCMQTSQYPKQVSAAVGRYLWYTKPEDVSDLWSNFYDIRIADEW